MTFVALTPSGKAGKDKRGKQDVLNEHKTQNAGMSSNHMQPHSEAISPSKKARDSSLNSSKLDASVSTSVGSERKKQMLPREHNMSREQLVAKVHTGIKEILNRNIHNLIYAASRFRGTNWLAAPPAFIIY